MVGSLAELESSAFSGLQMQLYWGGSYIASIEQAPPGPHVWQWRGHFSCRQYAKGRPKGQTLSWHPQEHGEDNIGFGLWGTAGVLLQHSHSKAGSGCGTWLWSRVVNSWNDEWNASWVGGKLYKRTRSVFLFRTVTSFAAEGEFLWKVSSTEMLMKYFRSKLNQNLLGTTRSLCIGYNFISLTT